MEGLIMNVSLFAMVKSSILIITKHTAHVFQGLTQNLSHQRNERGEPTN